MSDFCFIVPSYCNTPEHTAQLRSCLTSIREYHDNPIYVIDDHSEQNLRQVSYEFDDVFIIKSQVKGAGDMVTYFNYKVLDYTRAVIMQDSMNLQTALEGLDQIGTINHLWYFTNHRLHWSHIKEPQTEYNIANNIKVHDDLMMHCIERDIKEESFKEWAKFMYPQKNRWSGNIGCQSIIHKDFANFLNSATGIVDLMVTYNDNRLRRVAESLFPLACQFCLNLQASELAYDGLYYDGVNEQNGKRGNIICQNKYFSKISLNRRPIHTK